MVPQHDIIIGIFCSVDDFCNIFQNEIKKHQITNGKPMHNRSFTMDDSVVITITVLFHWGGFRNFKHFILDMFVSIYKVIFQKRYLIIALLN